MSDNSVEKTFLYLLGLSLLLHLAIYQLIALIPPPKPTMEQQATMVDLAELPELPPVRPKEPEPKPQVKKPAPQPQRITKELERRVPVLPRVAPPTPQSPKAYRVPAAPLPGTPTEPAPRVAEPSRLPQETREPVTRGEGLFRPKSGASADAPKLFPSAGKLARLEESYRRKYDREIEKGETSFLNSDDIRFGSFLRRFETAVYGVWRYPEAALVRGIQGTTPVRITFNRSGEIVNVELLESSGSGILDNEVLRTLKQVGPVGSFPKGYSSDSFKLIAFFQYGIGGGRLR
jgi:periplasmic protein TonB